MDPELLPFVSATTDADAASALDALLVGRLASVITETVRRELGTSLIGAEHVDDVAADVRLRMMRKLTSLRANRDQLGDDEAIANIAGYAAVTAERACYAFLRRQFPERTRFRNRVRYVLSRHPNISFAVASDGVWRAASTAIRRAAQAGASLAFLEDPRRWLHVAGIDTSQPLAQLVSSVVARFDRPIEFDRFVDALALALGVADAIAGRATDNDDQRYEPADPSPPIADVLEQREALLTVWKEIVELPARQRAALLLNLRDPEGGAVLQMLPGTGVVSQRDIAAALELSAEALDELWARLPLDDLSIAAALGITRQQVINLRKSARARLARRLREDQP